MEFAGMYQSTLFSIALLLATIFSCYLIFKYRWRGAVLSLLTFLSAFALISFSSLFSAIDSAASGMTAGNARCDLDLSSDQIHMPNTPWIVSVRGYACGFGIGATIDLAAINSGSKAVTILAKGEDLSHAIYSLAADGTVTVNIPNMSDIEIVSYSFGQTKVLYHWLPHDNPEERKAYSSWNRNMSSEANRTWYCNHVMPKMNASSQKLNDSVLAYTVFHENRKSYCGPS
jgi:hypothetical protein